MAGDDLVRTEESWSVQTLFKHPEYVLPAATLWLYLVASAHLDGYARYFVARGHWFNPSVFTLVAFSRSAVLWASGLAALYLVLCWLSSTESKWWWAGYALWLGALALLGIPFIQALHSEYAAILPWHYRLSVFGLLLWALMPLSSFIGSWRVRRAFRPVESDIERFEALKRQGRPESEWAPLRARAAKQLEEWNTPFRRGVQKWLWPVPIFGMAGTMLYIVDAQGFSQARRDFVASRSALHLVVSDASLAQTTRFREMMMNRVLMTDGHATLGLMSEGDGFAPYFRSAPEAAPLPLATVGAVSDECLAAIREANEILRSWGTTRPSSTPQRGIDPALDSTP